MREKDLSQHVFSIINHYADKYITILHGLSRPKLSVESMQYVTMTQIVPNDFFDDNVEKCSKDIFYKNFGDPIIIFNDLKDSTKILKTFEILGYECLYIAYIKYSSEMLSKLLDLLDGKIVENTGDGNYAIIEKGYVCHEIKKIKFPSDEYSRFCDYIELFDKNEYPKFKNSGIAPLKNLLYDTADADDLRYFLFILFAIFNIKINHELKKIGALQSIQFATRVGCKQGDCKIVRIEIDKHICQDKLIGSIVHEAAHQAAGK